MGSISLADSMERGEEGALMLVRECSVANRIGNSASGGGGGWALFNHRIGPDSSCSGDHELTNFSVRLRIWVSTE